MRGIARQGFDSNCSRACAKVEKTRPLDSWSDYIEKRFAETIRGRSHLKRWRAFQVSATIFSRDYSQLLNSVRTRRSIRRLRRLYRNIKTGKNQFKYLTVMLKHVC